MGRVAREKTAQTLVTGERPDSQREDAIRSVTEWWKVHKIDYINFQMCWWF